MNECRICGKLGCDDDCEELRTIYREHQREKLRDIEVHDLDVVEVSLENLRAPKLSGHYGYWCTRCNEPIKGDALVVPRDDAEHTVDYYHQDCVPEGDS